MWNVAIGHCPRLYCHGDRLCTQWLMSAIDRLIPVSVRELWPNEASDFTPWLHANPGILGDVLGTELFPEAREAAIARYSADLLFRDSSDRIVVVENMFGPTNHDHLGKLITYSAGLDAGVAVLVAEEFRDEHRSALDWLNHISQNDFAFRLAPRAPPRHRRGGQLTGRMGSP